MTAPSDSDCVPCRTAAAEGWWAESLPRDWTHCRDCHASWPGTQVWGHCSGCCTTFRGVRTFDDHHEAALCAPRRALTANEWAYGGHVYRRLTFDSRPGFEFDYYGTREEL